MRMLDIIDQLRRSPSTAAIFNGRVAGAADYSRTVDYANLEPPAAFVVFLSDAAEPSPRGANIVQQRLTTSWGVVVKVSAHVDIRGQDTAMQVPTIRLGLLRALLNWSPYRIAPAVPPPPGAVPGRAWTPMQYDACELYQTSRDATFWVFKFSTSTMLCEEDGEMPQYDLPEYRGANFKVDLIDPHDPGLPPSQTYDPRRGPPPWPRGPEGRIEAEFRTTDRRESLQ